MISIKRYQEKSVSAKLNNEESRQVPDSRRDRDPNLIRRLAVDLLVSGCVESYSDFFEVTREILLTDSDLIQFKEMAETSENSRLEKDLKEAVERYYSISKFFEIRQFHSIQIKYLKKIRDLCLRERKRTKFLSEKTALANLEIGLSLTSQKSHLLSLDFFREGLETPSTLKKRIAGSFAQACVDDYLSRRKDSLKVDLSLLEEALKKAETSEDQKLTAECLFHLGYEILENFKDDEELERSRVLEQRSLRIFRKLHDLRREARCHCVLARLFRERRNFLQAVEELNRMVELVQQVNDIEQEAEARHLLALIAFEQKDFPRTVKLSEYRFELCRQLDSKRALDNSRVLVGQARGLSTWSKYVETLLNPENLKLAVIWKTRRI